MNDNAHMESFFHSLKSEYIHGKRFDTDEQLRQTLRTYFSFYNHARIHTSLSRMPPASFELTKT
jgi:putative transposase